MPVSSEQVKLFPVPCICFLSWGCLANKISSATIRPFRGSVLSACPPWGGCRFAPSPSGTAALQQTNFTELRATRCGYVFPVY